MVPSSETFLEGEEYVCASPQLLHSLLIQGSNTFFILLNLSLFIATLIAFKLH